MHRWSHFLEMLTHHFPLPHQWKRVLPSRFLPSHLSGSHPLSISGYSPPNPILYCFLHTHCHPWNLTSPPACNLSLMDPASQDRKALHPIRSLVKGRINHSSRVAHLPPWAGIRWTGHLLRKGRGLLLCPMHDKASKQGEGTNGKEKVQIGKKKVQMEGLMLWNEEVC